MENTTEIATEVITEVITEVTTIDLTSVIQHLQNIDFTLQIGFGFIIGILLLILIAVFLRDCM